MRILILWVSSIALCSFSGFSDDLGKINSLDHDDSAPQKASHTEDAEIICIDKTPRLDGRLEEPFWRDADVYRDFYILHGNGMKTNDTDFRLAYDSSWIYIGVNCKNPAMKIMEPTVKGHVKGVKQDDSVEVFLESGTDGKEYFHFTLSFGNARDESRITVGKSKDTASDLPWLSAVNVRDDGWSAEIAIPLFIVAAAGHPENIRLNIGRNMKTPIIDPCGVYIDNKLEASSWCAVESGLQEINRAGKVNGWGKLDIETPSLSSISNVKVTPYYRKDGKNLYDISLALIEQSKKADEYEVVIEDFPVTGKPATSAVREKLKPNEQKKLVIPIVVDNFCERRIGVSLCNSTGLKVQDIMLDCPDALKIIKTYLDRNYYTTEENAVVVCSLDLPDETSRTLELVVKNAAGDTLSTSTSLSPEKKLTIPLKDLPVGENKIKISLNSIGSQAALFTKEETLIKREPNPGNEWKIDRINRVVLDNGKPFFPVGVVTGARNLSSTEWLFKLTADLGFNSIVDFAFDPNLALNDAAAIQELARSNNLYIIAHPECYATEAKKMDTFEKYLTPKGISNISSPLAYRSLVYLKSEIVNNREITKLSSSQKNEIFKELYDKTISDILKSVDVSKKYNNLIGYFIFDEPVGSRYFDQYIFGREFYKGINKRDGYHPVTTNFSGVPAYDEKMYDWYDIMMNDPYWTPPEISGVYSIDRIILETSKSVRNTEMRRQVTWIVPLTERWSASRKRVLTTQEQFCQTYLGIICGAKGLVYFIFPNLEYTRNSFKMLNKQLRVLSPAIVAPSVEQDVNYFRESIIKGKESAASPVKFDPYSYSDKNPEVLARILKDAKGYLLLVANSRYFPLTARYSIEGMDKNVKDIFNDKEFFVKENSFSDKLEGYGTRAYRLLIADKPTGEKINISVAASYCPSEIKAPENFYSHSWRKGHKNELPNPSAEFATIAGNPDYYWPVIPLSIEGIGSGKSNWELCEDNPYHGKYCIRMKGLHAQTQTYCAPQNSEPAPYVFSVYLRGSQDDMDVALMSSISGGEHHIRVGKEWKRYWIGGILPANAGEHTIFRVLLFEKQGTIWADAFQLEKGTEPTPFED